jgi:hypothetical protein
MAKRSNIGKLYGPLCELQKTEVYTEDNTADIDNISCERKFIQKTTLQL